MLQRIQTLFLALTILISVLLCFLFPFYQFNYGTDATGGVYALGYTYDIRASKINLFFPIIIGNCVLILTSLLTLLSYKKLKRQFSLARWNLVVSFLFLAFVVALPYIGHNTTEGRDFHFSFASGFYLLISTLVFAYLAFHFIKKDKELVDSIDRIR